MTLDQFLQASEAEQLRILWNARFVSERWEEEEVLCTRYQVFDFYVEVCVKHHTVMAFNYFNVAQNGEALAVDPEVYVEKNPHKGNKYPQEFYCG
ncbi:hypothetical protein LQ567_02185 [Niabella pedocola]|uniref:Uncharacterized protein n=1 Tax=Niabella pedocola TaxID=1752077 RepID=A0ABS8PKC4_9BACT|nr:hypothetical protein [Niabella pedocola]MCD2421552.1 hypothetical protein [Niabella pedocola]